MCHRRMVRYQTKEVFEEVGERVGETIHNIWGEAEELQHAFVSLFSKEGGLVRAGGPRVSCARTRFGGTRPPYMCLWPCLS